MLLTVKEAVPVFFRLTAAVAVVLRATLPKEMVLVERTTFGAPAGSTSFDGPTQPVLARNRVKQTKLKTRAHLPSMESTPLFFFLRGLGHACFESSCPEWNHSQPRRF